MPSTNIKMFLTLLALIFSLCLTVAEENCIRPKTILDEEQQCLESTTTFLERVQHRATGIFTLAKKKLGVDPEAENEPLKCDYYACVFRQMIVTDENNLIELKKLKTWITNNVPSVFTKEINAHATTCFEKLRSIDTIASDVDNNGCMDSMEMMNCLHLYDKCMIFKFP